MPEVKHLTDVKSILLTFKNTKTVTVYKLINAAKLLIQTTKVQPVPCSTILGKMGTKHTNRNSA